MGLTTFCGILTIQVGVTVLAAVFLTLGAVILVANVLEGGDEEEEGGGAGGGGGGRDGGGGSGSGGKGGGEEEESSMNYPKIFIMAFAIGLFIIGGLAFFSAYNESKSFAMLALLCLILLTTFWVILCILSFMGKKETVETVCRTTHEAKKALRCPESLWLADLDYRKNGDDGKEGGGGKTKGKREISYIFEDFVAGKLTSESSFISEIHQILFELRKLNSCLKYCYEENCLKIRKEDNSYCNLCTFANSKILKTGLIEANKPKETQKKGFPVNVSNELQFNLLQKHTMDLIPVFLGKLVTSPVGVTVPNTLLPLRLNKRDHGLAKPTIPTSEVPEVENITDIKTKMDDSFKTEDEKYQTEIKTEDKDKKGEEESSFKFGKPMIAAIALFVANLIFFLFTALMLWSWAQELGDDCYIDEIYYF